jgi:DNA-binding transcriptional LysR family regulator
MIELEQLRQLVAFAECGTLSRAAEALHISQPSLSRTMQALEEELQAALFNRQKNRIVLNEVGQVAVEHARQVLAAAEELARQVQLAERTGRSIALGSCAPVPIQDLRPLLQELYDGVAVAPELNSSDDALVDGLRQGRYQMVVTHEPPPQDEELFCFPYREEHLSLLVPVNHPLAQRTVIRAADLAHQNLLLYSEIGFWTQVCREKLPEAHFLFMNEWDAFGELVGLGAFPSFVTDAFAPGQSVENKIVIPIEDEDFQAVYYFLCLEKEREKFRELITRLQEKNFRTEPLADGFL